MPVVGVPTITAAAAKLRAGQLVIYPTETSYALGADVANTAALRKIFALKKRSQQQPLSLLCSSRAEAARYVFFSPLARRLAARYWPGPLTLVLPARRPSLAVRLGSQDGTIALRVSSHPTAHSLPARLGRPITATSANESGGKDSYSVGAIIRNFGGTEQAVYFMNRGTLARRRPSTVVRVRDHTLQVLRAGAIRPRAI